MNTLADFVAAPVETTLRHYRIETAGAAPSILEMALAVTIHPENAMAFSSAIDRAEELHGAQVEHIAYVPPGTTDYAGLGRFSRSQVMDAASMAF